MAVNPAVTFTGAVRGEILGISSIDVDNPLIGVFVKIDESGNLTITVDEDIIMTVSRGTTLTVEDQRTGYSHSAAVN